MRKIKNEENKCILHSIVGLAISSHFLCVRLSEFFSECACMKQHTVLTINRVKQLLEKVNVCVALKGSRKIRKPH
jgi:hypothetical protein